MRKRKLPSWGEEDRLFWRKLQSDPQFQKAMLLIERAIQPNGGELMRVAGIDYMQLGALAASRYEGHFDVLRWLEYLDEYDSEKKIPEPLQCYAATPRPERKPRTQGENP